MSQFVASLEIRMLFWSVHICSVLFVWPFIWDHLHFTRDWLMHQCSSWAAAAWFECHCQVYHHRSSYNLYYVCPKSAANQGSKGFFEVSTLGLDDLMWQLRKWMACAAYGGLNHQNSVWVNSTFDIINHHLFLFNVFLAGIDWSPDHGHAMKHWYTDTLHETDPWHP
jgi:hypothetical protein